MAVLILNRSDNPARTSALRVNHQSIRPRTWIFPAPDGVIARAVRGEVNHIEASGIIVMAEFTQLSAAECAAAEPHEHCTTSDHAHATSANVQTFEVSGEGRVTPAPPPPNSCCVLPQRYPVSLHFDIPVADGVVPPLGDNLILTMRAAKGQLEHQYETEIPGRNMAQLAGLPQALADSIAANAKRA